MTELKPCRVCGSRDIRVLFLPRFKMMCPYYKCMTCGLWSDPKDGDKEAKDAWNELNGGRPE